LAKDGGVSLTRFDGGILLRDIKYHLMLAKPVTPLVSNGDSQSYDQNAVAVAFIAHALREARAWFLRTQRELYGNYKLRWTFNLGLPSADFADRDLCATYENIAKAGWWLSVKPTTITLSEAERAIRSRDVWADLEESEEAEIHEVPEVAAEVAGYARSQLRDEGLHILVDVGATTLDVCGFILHKSDGDDCYELLTADVRRLGAMVLYQHRVSGVRQAVDSHVGELWNRYDPVSAMPDDLGAYLPCHDAIARSIHEHNEKYKKLCSQTLWRTIIDLKRKRDPNSPRWRSEMPVFVSGGGCIMPFYQSGIEELSRQLHEFYVDCAGVRRLSLAKPDNLVADVNEHTYHRLAVAWGLSYPETDIGQVTRPCDIEDIEPPSAYDWTKGFISKDMV